LGTRSVSNVVSEVADRPPVYQGVIH
jgi:hypothetical protein